MTIKQNVDIGKITWLSTYKGGVALTFYEPDCIDELVDLCRKFYSKGKKFTLIGHTSNTLFSLDYTCECMISTRKLNEFIFYEDYIKCLCGTSVRQLSRAAVDCGVKGFEGLIDLPGTVASAIYGHATCFGCDLSSLLLTADILTHSGQIVTVGPEWFDFKNRTSALKRGEKVGIIISVTLRRENGDIEDLKKKSDKNHAHRLATQPGAINSLGSIFKDEGKPTLLNRCISIITKGYGILLKLRGYTPNQIDEKRKHLTFVLLGGLDVEPYVLQWNWYQWKDERAHTLFWKYVRLHQRMFTKSVFEIEIKR